VIIRLGQPVRDVETAAGKDWRCPIQITGLGRRHPPPGIGVDSLQALVNALKIVHAHIEVAGRFEWLGGPGHYVPELTTMSPGVRRGSRTRRRL
jgi:hypothetical protein